MTDAASARLQEDYLRWKDFFDRFRYKPNFSFEVAHAAWTSLEANTVRIQMRVPDSRKPTREREFGPGPLWYDPDKEPIWSTRTVMSEPEPLVPVGTTMMLPRWESPQMAAFEVRKWITELEEHERDEWIRIDGVAVFNPHLNGDERAERMAAIREPAPRPNF